MPVPLWFIIVLLFAVAAIAGCAGWQVRRSYTHLGEMKAWDNGWDAGWTAGWASGWNAPRGDDESPRALDGEQQLARGRRRRDMARTLGETQGPPPVVHLMITNPEDMRCDETFTACCGLNWRALIAVDVITSRYELVTCPGRPLRAPEALR